MNLKLKEICEYFSRDFTASETSKVLNLSRPTVNYYYKIFREPIINDLFTQLSQIKPNCFLV